MTITDSDIERHGFNKGLEVAAKLAEGEVYKGRYRTWPWWEPDKFGSRGNLDREDQMVAHCDRIAAEIRKLRY